MFLANQPSRPERKAGNGDPAARERAARAVRETMVRHGISEAELRRVLDEVERERERQAALENRQAAQEHRRAREHALHVARQLVEFWRMEPGELVPSRGTASPREPRTATIKYQHPVSGESWDGNGPQPDWLRRALGPEGYRVAELQPGTREFAHAVDAAAARDTRPS